VYYWFVIFRLHLDLPTIVEFRKTKIENTGEVFTKACSLQIQPNYLCIVIEHIYNWWGGGNYGKFYKYN